MVSSKLSISFYLTNIILLFIFKAFEGKNTLYIYLSICLSIYLSLHDMIHLSANRDIWVVKCFCVSEVESKGDGGYTEYSYIFTGYRQRQSCYTNRFLLTNILWVFKRTWNYQMCTKNNSITVQYLRILKTYPNFGFFER